MAGGFLNLSESVLARFAGRHYYVLTSGALLVFLLLYFHGYRLHGVNWSNFHSLKLVPVASFFKDRARFRWSFAFFLG